MKVFPAGKIAADAAIFQGLNGFSSFALPPCQGLLQKQSHWFSPKYFSFLNLRQKTIQY
jgi:hypothetical protein